MINEKLCPGCDKTKSFDEFHKDRNRKDGHRCWCKTCMREYQREHRDKYGQTIAEGQRKRYLARTYGISLEDYDEMLDGQDGKCAICGTDNPGRWGRFAIDHNHVTGKIRGLLCFRCNVALGIIESDLYGLLLDYIKEHD